ncbi:I78 family peptidase inhibitor [Phytohalomonas tamaricis]|uniref:I78 family peptidase inhibitor n=1 Tax=Phytohalomonas tamaricis TaxID=2081032 RepID=UPI000D0B1E0B|nr:I78 family peptidase inhibitor [Phytohalomonas tamaricis]
MRRSLIGVLAVTGLLGGCSLWGSNSSDDSAGDKTQLAVQQDGDNAAQDSCGARRLDNLVGQALTQSVKQRIVDESQAQQYRMLRPGMMQTMDHNAQRLNITLDERGTITKFACG